MSYEVRVHESVKKFLKKIFRRLKLHLKEEGDKNEIFYTSISNVITDNNIKINYRQPSVYVYLENFSDSYDLTKIPYLVKYK